MGKKKIRVILSEVFIYGRALAYNLANLTLSEHLLPVRYHARFGKGR